MCYCFQHSQYLHFQFWMLQVKFFDPIDMASAWQKQSNAVAVICWALRSTFCATCGRKA